jgi:hypothetical protein
MSATSPSDLVVTFRSIPRRLDEARGEAGDHVADLVGEIDGQLRSAAALLHTSADTDAIADAIAARPAEQWDEAELAQLRTIALDVGRLLRAVAARTEPQDD